MDFKSLKYIVIVLGIVFTSNVKAQETDPMKLLMDMAPTDIKEPVTATFKGTRLVNQHTIEVGGKRTLDFRIAHRFGPFNSGAYNFWGLDGGASIRMSLEYSYDGRLQFGLGRSSTEKTYDSYLKYRLLRQNKNNSMPVSVTLFTSLYYTNLKGSSALLQGVDKFNNFSSRLSFAHQIMIARKFGERLSVQITPTMVHYNQVDKISDQNDTYAVGALGRYKFTRRTAFTFEYMARVNKFSRSETYYDSMGIGLDIETGGHVFQVHLTNSLGITENQFVTKTTDNWAKGGMRLGFNISRAFTL
jgi:hypothetical protein